LRSLFSHIQQLCLYAQLPDADGEFFIRRRQRDAGDKQDDSSSSSGSGKSGDESEGEGVDKDEESYSYADVWDDYSLRPAMVPSFLSPATAAACSS